MQITEAMVFERHVRSLLTLAGYNVVGEHLIGHKKVDCYAEETTLSSTRRIAIECKAHSSPLTQRKVTEIYANYLNLYETNQIDEILIVTIAGLTPTAVTMVKQTRHLGHLTISELQSRVIDFRGYLPQLVAEYRDQGLSSYYVPPRTKAGDDLEAQIFKWVDEGPPRPIALLAGYGMGKSTFTSHLAALLAEKAISDPWQRIPILVPLGEISSNQDLAGLLGKLFTSLYDVRNYRFETFLKLNSVGRFVVICDGFDEMKHTLSWEEFRFNLREINRLVKGDSRVLISGRPTAFLNEWEQQYALHGLRTIEGQDLLDGDWPDYIEVELAPFERPQIETFLDRYQDWLIESQLRRSSPRSDEKLEKKKSVQARLAAKRSKQVLREIQDNGRSSGPSQIADLVARPVHLKMLIDVLPQWDRDITQLTITILYQVFIDTLIQREQEKHARRRSLSGDERRMFARQLAWSLWQNGKRAYVRPQELPEELLRQFGQTKLEGMRRELIAGSLLDKKAGDVFYFPHRSIQEFLVAEELVDAVENGLPLSVVNGALTEEVYTFLGNLLNTDDFVRWEPALRSHRGLLSWNVGRLWVSEPAKLRWTNERLMESSVPWYLLFATAIVCKNEMVEQNLPTRLSDRIMKKIGTGTESAFDLLCFACVMALSRQSRVNHVAQALERIIAQRVYDLSKPRERKKKKKKTTKPIAQEQTVPLVVTDTDRWLRCIRVNKRSQSINLEAGHRVLSDVLRRYCFLSDWMIESMIRTQEFILLEDIGRAPRLSQLLDSWALLWNKAFSSQTEN